MAKRRRATPNGTKRAVKQQADSLGLEWDVHQDEHDWQSVSVMLDAYAQGDAPRPVDRVRVVITDTKDKVGKNTREEYFASVRSAADEVADRVRSGELDEDELQEAIDQEAEGSYWVIYTHANIAALWFSDNWLAIDEWFNDAGGVHEAIDNEASFTRILSLAAYMAVRDDIRQYVSAQLD